jgi:dihydropteroate synthase
LVQSAPAERLAGTLALSVAHYTRGARLFRVHDVAPHVQALGATHAALPL